MTIHQKIVPLIPTEPTPLAVPGSKAAVPQKRWTTPQIALAAGGALLVWQLLLPVKYTPGGVIGRILVAVEKQKDMAEAEIQAMRDHLRITRATHSETMTGYQALAAKCTFAGLIDPQLARICQNALDMNYKPQLDSLRSEIDRLQAELRNLEGSL